MPLRNKDALAFTREVLRPRVTRPQVALGLYPDVESETKVEVQVTNTTVAFRFGTDVENITFTDLSVPDLAATINRSSTPIRAVALTRAIILKPGDLLGPASYKQIPSQFEVYDRVTDNGAVLRVARYTVKYDRLSNIKLRSPYPDSPGLPWRPVITNGSFTQEYRDRRFHFSIPESANQAWSLAYGRPFKDVNGVPVSVRGDNVIQVPRFPIHWTEDNMLFFAGDAPLSTSIIEDVDVYNGLVYTKQGFSPDNSLTVDYSYLEINYIYPYLNINAHFAHNPDLIDKFVVFYMLPVESLVASRTHRTIFHLVGDSLLGTIDSIEQFDVDEPIAIIGAYSIQQIIASDRATILDTRVLGGGLRDGDTVRSTVHTLEDVEVNPDTRKITSETLVEAYKDSARFYDLGKFDGEPYPGAAAVVLDVPDHLRIILPEDRVRSKASKFLAAGVYPIFEFSSRTGEYTPGFAQDISSVGNLDFSGQFTGSYWSPTDLSIPSGTVMVDWKVPFEPSIHITGLDNTSVLHVTAGSGYCQPYLKSSPDTIIEWEERVLVALSGNNNPTEQYSRWEKKRFADTRDVGDGQLMQGFILAEAPYETKQFRDFSIFSPYRTSQTGELLKEMGRELGRIQHRAEDLSSTDTAISNKMISQRFDDVRVLHVGGIPAYVGTHEIYNNVFDLGTSSKASGAYSPIAREVGTGILRSFSESPGLAEYQPGDNLYDTTNASTMNLGSQLEMLTSYTRYLLDTVGSGDSQYFHSLSGYANILVQMSGTAYQVPVSGDKYWIEPDYMFDGTSLSGDPISVTTGYRNVDVSGEAHRMTEILPGLIGIWNAIPFSHAEFFSDNAVVNTVNTVNTDGNVDSLMITEVPGFVLDSYSGVVVNYLPQLLTGSPKDGAGTLVADSWYSPHNLYGTLAGTIARDGMLVYEALTSGKGRLGAEQTARGATSGDRTYIAGRVEYILDTVITGFAETLLKGGILDEYTPRLLEAYALASYRGKLEADGDRGDFTGRRMAYSGIYATGIDIVLRSMVTPEGDIQERTIVDQSLGAFSGTPPADIITALSAGALLDDKYLAHLQGAFRTLTGVYSNRGAYPYDANLSKTEGGREADIFKALSVAFLRLQDKFPDPDMLDIFRKAKN